MICNDKTTHSLANILHNYHNLETFLADNQIETLDTIIKELLY